MNHLKEDQIDAPKKESKKCVFHKQSNKKEIKLGDRKWLHNVTEKKAVTA